MSSFLNTDYRARLSSCVSPLKARRCIEPELHLWRNGIHQLVPNFLNHRYQNVSLKTRLKRTRRFTSTQPVNCGHQIITSAGGFVLRSELLRILFRVTTIATEQSIRGTVLIVLVSLILFRLIKLVESLASIRKTVPRVLCGQMREL